MKYDVVIIGSGLGGLECGALLAKEGFHVCVLEKNVLYGGCLQTYERRGYRLDTGIHYLGSMEEGQVLNQCFRYMGIMDKLRLKKMDESGFDRVCYRGRSYDYAMGHERFAETLAEAFPSEREHLERYARELRRVGELVSVEQFRKGTVSAEQGLSYFGVSAADVIETCVQHPDLRNILAGTSLLYGGVRSKSTFYEHGMILNSYIEGAYRCIDGSMQIADELVRVIRGQGGEVRNRSEVTRICVENEVATAVEVNRGERIEAGCILSDVHPAVTLDMVDPNRSIKRAYRSRIHALENSYGLFTLYLLMKPGRCPYLNHNIYLHRDVEVWHDRTDYLGRTPNAIIAMQAHEGAQRYADVVSVLTPMYMDELRQWEHTRPEHRGDDYLQLKARKAGQLEELLGEHGIDYADAVACRYTTTPLSYRDYTATADGSAYGIIKDCRYPIVSLISPRTKLKNLLLTGQNLNVHGALGVTLTAILTCAELVGQEYLTKKIGYA